MSAAYFVLTIVFAAIVAFCIFMGVILGNAVYNFLERNK